MKTPDIIKQKIGIDKGSGATGSEFVGNISLNDVIEIAKQLLNEKRITAKSLKSAVKEVAGTCLSIGVTIENKNPKDLIKEINEGKYDDVIV